MRGFSELAFEVFGRDIYRPELPEISGIQASFKDPRYATSIGLIRYAQILQTERAEPPGLMGRVGRWGHLRSGHLAGIVGEMPHPVLFVLVDGTLGRCADNNQQKGDQAVNQQCLGAALHLLSMDGAGVHD